jgi:hypothetical protein
VLGEAVIELKALDDEGLVKPERQAKLAALFRKHETDRPVLCSTAQISPQRSELVT